MTLPTHISHSRSFARCQRERITCITRDESIVCARFTPRSQYTCASLRDMQIITACPHIRGCYGNNVNQMTFEGASGKNVQMSNTTRALLKLYYRRERTRRATLKCHERFASISDVCAFVSLLFRVARCNNNAFCVGDVLLVVAGIYHARGAAYSGFLIMLCRTTCTSPPAGARSECDYLPKIGEPVPSGPLNAK